MYNTDAVDSTAAPRTWDDLLDERFRDRIVIRAPLGSGTMRTIFGAMIQRAPSVEEGFRWLARLDENTKTYAANPTQLYLSIARGEGERGRCGTSPTPTSRAATWATRSRG